MDMGIWYGVRLGVTGAFWGHSSRVLQSRRTPDMTSWRSTHDEVVYCGSACRGACSPSYKDTELL